MSYVRPDLLSLIEQLNNLTLKISGLVNVTGSVAVTNLPATQPVSLLSLPMAPIQLATTATITVSPVVTTASVKIISANPNRKGILIYNNSANSGYLAYGQAANSSTSMTRILATFTQFAMETPIYTGDIYAIRNAGTGTFIITELT